MRTHFVSTLSKWIAGRHRRERAIRRLLLDSTRPFMGRALVVLPLAGMKMGRGTLVNHNVMKHSGTAVVPTTYWELVGLRVHPSAVPAACSLASAELNLPLLHRPPLPVPPGCLPMYSSIHSSNVSMQGDDNMKGCAARRSGGPARSSNSREAQAGQKCRGSWYGSLSNFRGKLGC